MPRVKMVGNMMELNSPIPITLHIASAPVLRMVVASKAIATRANTHNSARGAIRRSNAAPMKRPVIAAPQ